MYRREQSSAASMVRLPPLHRNLKQSVSRLEYVQDVENNPWIIDNPALRQLSTAASRVRRTKSRLGKRSFRNKVILPDISLHKTRHISSARSMRSTISTISSATVKSTKSLDMFRYGDSNRRPSAVTSVPGSVGVQKWRPGSTRSTDSVLTIPLPPIGNKTRSELSADEQLSTADLDDYAETESLWHDRNSDIAEETKIFTEEEPDLKMALGEDYLTQSQRDTIETVHTGVQLPETGTSYGEQGDMPKHLRKPRDNENDRDPENNSKQGKEALEGTGGKLSNKSDGHEKAEKSAEFGKTPSQLQENENDDEESESKEGEETEISCKDQMNKIFAGDYRRLPLNRKSSIRVLFIASSTDFHEEREWFVSRCYTELQSHCSALGLDFQLIDLELPGFDHVPADVMDVIYREQLKLCQELSAGPTVLAFVNGDDLPRPVPHSIPAEDFHAIRELAEAQGLLGAHLLESCYTSSLVKSENGDQQLYQLNQLKDGLLDVDEEFTSPIDAWASIALRLREVLRKTLVSAVLKGKFSKDKAKTYLESVPDDQVMQTIGALPRKTQCYIRRRKFEGSTKENEGSESTLNSRMGSGGTQHYGPVYLNVSHKVDFKHYELKERGSIGHVYDIHPLMDHNEEPAYISQQQRLYLTKFCEDLAEDFKCAVGSDMIKGCSKDCICNLTPLHAEVLHHARLCVSRSVAYKNTEILQVVKDYILDENHCMVPLIISGEADKNKSKLAAAISRSIAQWIHPETVVITRFLKTSPDSRDIKWVLVGIIYQVCRVYQMAMPKVDELLNFDRTVGCLNALITSVAMQSGVERPLVIILDSLESLTSVDGNHTTAWIPQLCPPNVYLIATISSGSKSALSILQFKLMEKRSFLSLDENDEKDIQTESDGPPQSTSSSDRDGQETPRAESDPSSHDIDGKSRDDCVNPTEDPSLKENQQKNRHVLQRNKQVESKSLASLVSRRLDILEKRYGELVMSWLLSYICIDEGLSEVELADALSCNTDVMEEVFIGSDVPKEKQWRFPQKLLSLIRRDISKFLEQRYIDGKTLLCIGDEQVQETVKQRYLNAGRKTYCCLQMAELLRSADTSGTSGANEVWTDYCMFNKIAPQELSFNSKRQLRMLPRLLYRSGPFSLVRDEIKSDTLCNFKWILTKLKAFEFDIVCDDYRMIKERECDIEYVYRLLMLAKTVLQRNPEKLGAEILARCSKQVRDRSVHLSLLWTEALRWFEMCQNGLHLMPVYPCLSEPTGFLTRSLQGPWHVLANCANDTLAVWGKETGLELWNSLTYECVHHFYTPFTWEDSILSQEQDILYQTLDTRFIGWDVKSCKLVCDIDILPDVSVTGRRQNPNTDDSFLSPMCISPGKIFAAVRINKSEMLLNNKGLAVVDLQRELVVHSAIEAMGDRVSNCCFTKDNNRLVVTETQILPGQTSVIHVFDCLTMETMGRHELDANLTVVPDTMFLTANDEFVVIGCWPDNILVYATKDCKPHYVPQEFPEEDNLRFVDMKILPNDMVMQLSIDATQASVLRMTDLSGQVHGMVMTSNTARPKFVNVSAKYSLAFVGHLDNGSIAIWDFERGALLYMLQAHTGHITSTLLSPDTRRLYTGATDGTIHIWDLENMLISKGYYFEGDEQCDGQEEIRSTHGDVYDKACLSPKEGSRTYEQKTLRDTHEDLKVERINNEDELDGTKSIHESSLNTSAYATSEETVSLNLSHSVESNHETTPTPTSRTPLSNRTGLSDGRNSVQRTSCRSDTDDQRGTHSISIDLCHQSEYSTLNGSQIEEHIGKGDTQTVDPTEGKGTQQLTTYEEQYNYMLSVGEKVGEQPPPAQGHAEESVGVDELSPEDLNTKLEEIFHKLDNPSQMEYPDLDQHKSETPALRTTVLGSQGEGFQEHPSEIVSVNKFVLAGERPWLISSYKRGPPIVWNIETSDVICRLEMPWDTGAVTEIMLDREDTRLFALARLGFADAQKYGCDNCVRAWDLRTGSYESMTDEPLLGDSFKLTPDKKKIILLRMRENGTRFTVVDANTMEKMTVGEVACQLKSPYFCVTSDVSWIITCEPGVKISFWNIKKEDEYGVSEHTDVPIASIPPAMELLEEENRLLVGTGYGNIFSLDLDRISDLPPTSELYLVRERHEGEVLCLKISEDHKMLLSSSADTTVRLIDVEQGKVRHVFKGHREMVTCVDISRCNQLVLSGSVDKTVRLWSAVTGQILDVFSAYNDVFAVHFCPLANTVIFLMDQQNSRTMVMAKIVGQRNEENRPILAELGH